MRSVDGADCALAASGAAERTTMAVAKTALAERSVGRFMVPHSLTEMFAA